MLRSLLTLAFAVTVLTAATADPVKKAPAVDADKATKECAEAFIKAILDGKVDDAIKLCATPFREPGGNKSETLDNLKKEFDRPPPAGIEIKVGEVIALEKYNEWIKKKGGKELEADQIKEYGEYIGKEGRIIMLDVSHMGQKPPAEQQPHMLVRIKDGKAQIVGVGGR